MTDSPGGAPASPPAKLDVRHSCGRLLFRGLLAAGSVIEIRCPRCGRMHVIDTRPVVVALVVTSVVAGL